MNEDQRAEIARIHGETGVTLEEAAAQVLTGPYKITMDNPPADMLESIERAALRNAEVEVCGVRAPAMCVLDWMRGVDTVGGHLVDMDVKEALRVRREADGR